MSRTVKHRNKDGSQNDYIKNLLGVSYYDVEDVERMVKYYQRQKAQQSAPKAVRKQINRSCRKAGKQSLAYSTVINNFDDQPSAKWMKNAGYFYF